MEAETPTFCKEDFLYNIIRIKKNSCFSNFCDGIVRPTPKGKYSCQNITKSFHKHKKEKPHKEHHKKRQLSEKFKLRDITDRQEKHKKINNINSLMKKHKFKLRNDFDKTHVEQFLSSKEEAFEIPFLLYDENNLENTVNIFVKTD